MPKITITFQEEGDVQSAFIVPAEVVTKLEQYIQAVNTNPVLGVHINSKTEFFAKECYTKILKPVVDAFPDAQPQEALDKLAQAAALQQEAEAIIAAANIQPIQLLPPEV